LHPSLYGVELVGFEDGRQTARAAARPWSDIRRSPPPREQQ
jgi:hypothetical protein